jgi:hypothetical protein
MPITGPSQIVFGNSSAQENLSLALSNFQNPVAISVTATPNTVASVRTSVGSSPLALGASLTTSQLAALFVTRTSSGTGLGSPIGNAATTAVRWRHYNSGTSAPAFSTSSTGVTQVQAVNAVKAGNFWLPGFPVGTTGTRTIDILFSSGTAITLGRIADMLIGLNYTGQTVDQWTGVVAQAITSTNGTAVTVHGNLTISASSGEPLSQKLFNGQISGAAAATWYGLRLTNVPPRYPCVFGNFSVQPTTAAPIYGPLVGNSSVTVAKWRHFASGTTVPALVSSAPTMTQAAAVDAIKAGNFWLPDWPGAGSTTRTVDILFDTGTALTLGQVQDLLASLNYTGQSSNQWVGVTAKAITSSDGVAVTVRDNLTITANVSEPNSQKLVNGTVAGASSARWFGVRFENVPPLYPFVFGNIGFRAITGTSGTSYTPLPSPVYFAVRAIDAVGAYADFTVAIGDTSTNFAAGTPPPPPPPPNPLPNPTGANAIVYGDPGTRFPLNIALGGMNGSFTLTVPSGLSLAQETITQQPTISASTYTPINASSAIAPVQSGSGVSANTLAIVGTGASFDGTYLNLPQGTYLNGGAFGVSLPTTTNPATTQTPRSMMLNFVGILPVNETPLVSLYSYNKGQFALTKHWETGKLRAYVERDGQVAEFISDAAVSTTQMEDIGVEYIDNMTAAGGTVRFLRNGVAFGTAFAVPFKLRIPPDAELNCNASIGNTANSNAIKVRKIAVSMESLVPVSSFTPVTSGTVDASTVERLFADATAVTVAQPFKTVTYQKAGNPAVSLDVVIGPLVVPTGQAFRAVLENWSTGVAVSHPSPLVMTKLARQNCRFEDVTLFASQPAWSECLPQGPVPVINGIEYRCEAIRMAGYTQFQFGYDWNAATMPDNPFGDPTGKESYMVPHKWRIEDAAGNVLATIQRPDGGPLNGTDIPRIFSGSYDGNGYAITNGTNKWYPHGTVRSGIIWRSGTPPSYDQSFINSNLPRFDVTVPYGSHTHFSNNGFDPRIYSPDSSNGFGNTRVMPYEPTNYASLTTQVGVTQDPWKGSLYNFTSLAAVASTWLRYTPFNQAGRSPLTGPGGVRDDRCAIAEPVAQYMYNITANRPHDGRPFAQIALDYLTSYASDPYHCYEKGRCVPLYKGVNANRDIGLRGHYYGYGEASRPASKSYYAMAGRQYDMATSYDPWRATVPSHGTAVDKPTFGVNAIDLAHAHQFPHWGTLLWKTPEFAFLGHKFSDQARMYEPWIIGNANAQLFGERSAAWQYLHSALCWKTGSANSDRLYRRSETLDFVIKDFEWFHDNHLVSTPGFNNPPANLLVNGQIDGNRAVYAAAQRFGVITRLGDNEAFGQHDFFIGYWLTALGIAEKVGFNAAVRGASVKAAAVLNWLIAKHRQRVLGRINQASVIGNATGSPFTFRLWTDTAIAAAGGVAASLPQNYAALSATNGSTASWDVWNSSGASRDGQAMDQLIAGPSILKNQLAQTGADIDSALATASGWRNQKKTAQEALGANGAGTSWFIYLQAVNNLAIS